MGDNSAIEWTDATWNPIVGCSLVSPGCTNCYAMRTARRLDGNSKTPHYAGTTRAVKDNPVWTGHVARAPERILTVPLHWKKPRRIFVNSMGDLFHEAVPDGWIEEVFAIMALCPQHTFQVLTKRPARMRQYLNSRRTPVDVWAAAGDMMSTFHALASMGGGATPWPLANVWLGVSVEDQALANERIPLLLKAPAAVHFVSAEPLLGPINFRRIFVDGRTVNYLPGLDWVIAGGETGPDARPMDPDWARSIRDQCAAPDVPFFFKQWDEGGDRAVRGGRRMTGRLLDGREHNAMPR